MDTQNLPVPTRWLLLDVRELVSGNTTEIRAGCCERRAARHLLIAPQRLQRDAVVRIPEEVEFVHLAAAQVQEAHVVPARASGSLSSAVNTSFRHGRAHRRSVPAKDAPMLHAV